MFLIISEIYLFLFRTHVIIGSIYLEGGPGLKPNLKEAIKWYLKAANGGVNAAKIRLEKLCCKGNK